MFASNKVINFLIATFSLAIILVTFFLWWARPPKTFIYPKKMPAKEAKRKEKYFIEIPSISPPTYEYKNILTLLKNFRTIELSFYSNFEKFSQNYSNVQKMNTFYKRTIPSRKCNALRYHLRVIERSIDDLEDFIKKIKLNKRNANN